MYLFLDFDGVLHTVPQGHRGLFCFLPKVERVLTNFSHVKIVISSSWRHDMDLDDMLTIFNPATKHRVVGVTLNLPANDHSQYRRQAEIVAWMRANAQPGDQWLALDDQPSEFEPDCAQLILCDPRTGFAHEAEVALRAALMAASSNVVRDN